MSATHIYLDTSYAPTPAPGRVLLVTFRSLTTLAGNSAARLLSAFQHRLAMRRIERLADHQLKDIGFERDWDGSVVRVEWQR